MKVKKYNKGGKNGKQKTVKFAPHGITSFEPSLRERAMAKGAASKKLSELSEEEKKKLNTKYKRGGKMMSGGKLPNYMEGGKYRIGGRVGDPKKEKDKNNSTSAAISFDMSATSKKEQRKIDRDNAKKERKAEKDMIPAKYRNRGQAGLDRYKADMARKRSKKNAKGLAKIFGTKAARKKAAETRKAARASNRRRRGNKGAGCQGKGCGAFE